jgi:hypothetical protein
MAHHTQGPAATSKSLRRTGAAGWLLGGLNQSHWMPPPFSTADMLLGHAENLALHEHSFVVSSNIVTTLETDFQHPD